jgi:hypothetical protein
MANRQRYINRARRRKRTVGKERIAYLIEFLSSHPCVDCGETDPVVLEFDHVAEKAFTIGRASGTETGRACLPRSRSAT